MTVSSSTSKSRYTGNGVTTAFTGSFRILDETHVKVTHTSTLGVDTVKTIVTDYTVSGVGGSSFTVTHGTAPASGVIVTLSRNVPATQELDLVENDAMPADDLEDAFDKATMLFQQAAEGLDRSIRFPVSDSTSRTAELPVASLRAGKIPAFDADGDVIVSTLSLDDIESGSTDAAASAVAAAASASAASASASAASSAQTAAEVAQAAAEAAAAGAAEAPGYSGNGDKIPVVNSGGTGWLYKTAAQLVTFLSLVVGSLTFTATSRILARKSALGGAGEECTLSEVLDFIGSAAQGDILYRGASAWARLAAGTSGQFLKTQGAGANPAWDSVSAAIVQRVYAEYTTQANFSTTIPFDDTKPQNTEGTQIVTVSITPTSATNRLRIRYGGNWGTSGTNHYLIAAVFQSGSSDALRTAWAYDGNGVGPFQGSLPFSLEVEFVAGTTSALTISARVGSSTGAAIYINGSDVSRYFGGSAAHTLVVEELKV